MAEAFISLPPDSTGKKLRAQEVTAGGETVEQEVVTLAGPDGSLVDLGQATKAESVPVVLPSDAALPAVDWSALPPGATYVSKTSEDVTASATVHTVATGRTFHLTSFQLTVGNSSTMVGGEVSVNDSTNSTNRLLYFTTGIAFATTAVPSSSVEATLPVPVRFTTAVRLEVVAGTVVAALNITGFEV